MGINPHINFYVGDKMVKIENVEMYERINKILWNLYLRNICNDVKENGVFYVSSHKKENLEEIKYHIDNKFKCQTSFVPQCCAPCATPCDDWEPDEENQEWCLKECKERILRIDTNQEVNDKEFIKQMFEEVWI